MKLEKKLGQNLHSVECALHRNELTFQFLFKKLDGATIGLKFQSTIGKAMQINCYNQSTLQFKPVENSMKIPLVAEKVLNDLRTDQRLLFEHTK